MKENNNMPVAKESEFADDVSTETSTDFMPVESNAGSLQKSRKKTEKKNAVEISREGIRENDADRDENGDLKIPSFLFRMVPFFLGLAGVFLLVCYIFSDRESIGVFGNIVNKVIFGLFSVISWAVPFLLFNLAIFWYKDYRKNRLWRKIISTLIFLVLLCATNYYISFLIGGEPESLTPASVWNLAQQENGFKYGGIFGAYLGWCLCSFTGNIATGIILGGFIIVFAVFLLNISPEKLLGFIGKICLFIGKQIFRFLKFIGRSILRGIKKAFLSAKKKRAERKAAKAQLEAQAQENDDQIGDYHGDDDVTNNDVIIKDCNTTNYAPPPSGRWKLSEQTVRSEVPAGNEIIYSCDPPERGDGTHSGKSIDPNELFDNDSRSDENPACPDIIQGEGDGVLYGADNERKEPSNAAPGIRCERTMLMKTEEEEQVKKPYVFPPLDYLETKPVTKEDLDYRQQCQEVGKSIVDHIATFGVNTKLVEISIGPSVTRYAIAPERGVKISSIAGLSNDIQCNLATKTAVRIEAPIPGKSAVGVEIPNPKSRKVYLSELVSTDTFLNAKSKLTAALGLNIAGEPVYMDIAAMPHLLIAGTTGSGKSVCMNCIILSLLYKASPDEVKFVMIDPKEVEFSVYDDLPHMLHPVITNAGKAAGALNWLTEEMDRRYSQIKSAKVREVDKYNEIARDDASLEYLPKIVVFIDELADLMMQAKKAVETSICRIAQKGRACGIHLIVGTQRPSVDVITGLIKANIPSRIAFKVSSPVDSRTIINGNGAEDLIGKGDMLYHPIGGQNEMVRLQGAFVKDAEIEHIVDYLANNNEKPSYDENILIGIEKSAINDEDDGSDSDVPASFEDSVELRYEGQVLDKLFAKCVEIAIDSNSIATSHLQVDIGIGYGRAARIISMMQKLGIVGPPNGQKPREVLMNHEQWEVLKEKLSRN